MTDTRDWRLRAPGPDLAENYRRAGFWTDTSLGALLCDGLASHPGLAFTLRSELHPWHGTFGEVLSLAQRLAGSLRSRGIGPGDVVAFQLPNWLAAAVTFYGATLAGATVAPIVHFYGPAEVRHVLAETEAVAMVTYRSFGALSGVATLEAVRSELPALQHVWVVDGQPDFSELLEGLPVDDAVPVDPSWPALVAYTSGTTAAPKGVVHTHRSIASEIRQLSAVQPDLVPPIEGLLVGAPVGHGIGMLAALLLPVWGARPIHLIDRWDPPAVLAAMLESNLAAGSGSTYFLTSLLDDPGCTPEHLRLMASIGLGGSSVPLAVTERAAALGVATVRSYGSTEHPSITGATFRDPAVLRQRTDGRPLPGVELRLDDEGVIYSRGPDLFAGYVDPAQTAAVLDEDGWYCTEDIGVLDEHGWLTITDRRKDIIIRGGENISAAEVEEHLLRLPGVAEAAVVAAPDARLGEHAAAVLRLLPDAELDLPGIRSALEFAGIAKQKWPEEVHVVAALPRTPSGKVQKAVLRERLRNGEL